MTAKEIQKLDYEREGVQCGAPGIATIAMWAAQVQRNPPQSTKPLTRRKVTWKGTTPQIIWHEGTHFAFLGFWPYGATSSNAPDSSSGASECLRKTDSAIRLVYRNFQTGDDRTRGASFFCGGSLAGQSNRSRRVFRRRNILYRPSCVALVLQSCSSSSSVFDLCLANDARRASIP